MKKALWITSFILILLSTITTAKLGDIQKIIVLPAQIQYPIGLTFDGTNFWVSDGSSTLYKINLNGNILTTLNLPGETFGGLEWDGTYLWAGSYTWNSGNKISKIDVTLGSIVSSFPTIVPTNTPIAGLTYDSTTSTLWYDRYTHDIVHVNTLGVFQGLVQIDPYLDAHGLAADRTCLYHHGDSLGDVEMIVQRKGATAVWQTELKGNGYEDSADMAFDPLTFPVPVVWYLADHEIVAREVHPCTPLCGNGAVDPGEECDDGNNNPNDGCDQCKGTCFDSDGGVSIEKAGTVTYGINNYPDTCFGNFLEEFYCANCNATNSTNATGTSPNVQNKFIDCTTYGYTGCSNGACVPSSITEPPFFGCGGCGNGILEPGEQCDDGNGINDDGCSNVCRKEYCGDGVAKPPEVCDDGNHVPGDGCDPNCKVEFCGDGIVNEGTELCDDGNNDPTDGCDNCKVTYCGDGVIQNPNGQGTGGPNNDGREQCDDGNNKPNDGCTNCIKDKPLAVNWAYYNANCGNPNTINVYWGTTLEVDTLGFYVNRAPAKIGPWNQLPGFIWATGSGSNYQYPDNSPLASIYNWYKVQELTFNGPGDTTEPFTTERICDQPIYCGGITGQHCPEGYTCICPRPTPGTTDQTCTCQTRLGTAKNLRG